MTRFSRLALLTTVATLALVGVGGLVRATGSGLGCHDSWPTCRGGWIAPPEYRAWIEYSHRVLAAVCIALVVALVVGAHRWKVDRTLRRWCYLTAGPFVLQAGLGAVVVKGNLHAALVTGHFVAAMLLVLAMVRVTAGAYMDGRPPATGDERRLARMAAGAAGGTFLVLLAGTYVREKGAGLVFRSWPLMHGHLLGVRPGAMLVHRVLAAAVFAHVLATAVRARRDARRGVRTLAFTGAALYAAQILVGAANIWTSLAPAAVMGHVITGALTWAALVALVVVSRSGAGAAAVRKPRRVLAYVALTKPRIILLLLVTTVPTMVIAARGLPSGWLVAATLFGGTLASGGANAINQYLDRDIDEKMRRTRARPLPAHTIVPGRALGFGIALGVLSFAWLWWTVNLLSALLAVAAILFYVFVYTVWMKRSTPHNIVIGGAAGAVPVLVGWAAVTGTVGLPAWVLFAIVFCWTPPHFWALAMRYRDDYEAAGVPMLPVVRGLVKTTRQIVVYSVLLVAVSLLLYPVGKMGRLYLAAALALGAAFLYRAVRLRREPSSERALGLFKYSISYLALLFACMGADRLVIR